MIRMLELFGGIGAFRAAMEELGYDFETVDYVENDKYAVKSYNAMYNENYEIQDIKTWNKDLEVDIIMHGSPCQDYSLAGNGKGGDEGSGTRSSLMWYTVQIIEKLLPPIVIWENVTGVLNKKHKHNFDKYLSELESLGYTNSYEILKAQDFGTPQSRKRIFVISTLAKEKAFKFPKGEPLKLCMGDLLEDTVSDKYYLSDKMTQGLKHKSGKLFINQNTQASKVHNIEGNSPTLCAGTHGYANGYIIELKHVANLDIKGNDQIRRVYDKSGLCPTLNTMQGGNRQPKIIEDKFYLSDNMKRYINSKDSKNKKSSAGTYVVSEARLVLNRKIASTVSTRTGQNRADCSDYICKTLPAEINIAGVDLLPFNIRKLTPKECWRLMGFKDEYFNKAQEVCSNTQLYKQAGNSIVVKVLMAIFKQLKEGGYLDERK